METISKRISVSIPIEIEKDLDELKKTRFYKEPQSEMLRYLIKLGIQANKELVKEEWFIYEQPITSF